MGAPFVALAEDLEEKLCPGVGQGHEAQFIDDEQPDTGQLLLNIEPPALGPGPSSSLTRAAAVVEPADSPLWQVAKPRPRTT